MSHYHFKKLLLSQGGEYTLGREVRWSEGNNVILEMLAQGNKVKVLDIGCGEGAGYSFLKESIKSRGLNLNNLEYHAIDNNQEVELLLKDSGIIFHLNDIANLGTMFSPESFDFIIASEIIEHMVDPDAFILTLKTLLKNNGYIYLTTPNLASWHGRLMLLFGLQPLATEVSTQRAEFGKGHILYSYYSGQAIMHMRVFTLRALKDFLHYHGFKINNIWGGGYRIDRFLFHKLLVGLSPILKVLISKK